MKTILVPTDYSDNAQNALNYATQLAKLTKAKLILFHVYHIPIPTLEVPVILVTPQELQKENDARIKKIADKIQLKSTIKIEWLCRAGFAVDEIEAVAMEKKVDLIVMGLRGSSILSEMIIGSHTIGVIRKGICPILVIPDKSKYTKPLKIIFSSDFQSLEKKNILNMFKEFVQLYHSKVYVLHVTKPGETAKLDEAIAGLKLENYLENIDHSLYFPENENVIKGINEFVKKHNADMVVMIPHKHGLLERALFGSVTKKMAFNTNVPLLALPDRENKKIK